MFTSHRIPYNQMPTALSTKGILFDCHSHVYSPKADTSTALKELHWTLCKLKWSTHTDSVVKKAQQCLLNLRSLKKFGLSPNTHKLLQMHNREHPVGLYHRLVRQLCRPKPQGSPEGGAVCTMHHRGQTYLPSMTPTIPDVTGRQKSNQITTRATACSPRYHSEDEVSTGASKRGPRDCFYLKTIRLLNSHH